MADFSTTPGRAFTGALYHALPQSFAWSGETEYAIPGDGRVLGSGGSGETVFVDRIIYNDAPPSALGPGDWGIRFFSDQLAVMGEAPGGVPLRPTLYVTPGNARGYIREFELFNASAAPRVVELWFAGFPVFTGVIPANTRHKETGLWVTGAGELAEGFVDAAVAGQPGVHARATGVLEVGA